MPLPVGTNSTSMSPFNKIPTSTGTHVDPAFPLTPALHEQLHRGADLEQSFSDSAGYFMVHSIHKTQYGLHGQLVQPLAFGVLLFGGGKVAQLPLSFLVYSCGYTPSWLSGRGAAVRPGWLRFLWAVEPVRQRLVRSVEIHGESTWPPFRASLAASCT